MVTADLFWTISYLPLAKSCSDNLKYMLVRGYDLELTFYAKQFFKSEVKVKATSSEILLILFFHYLRGTFNIDIISKMSSYCLFQ